MSDVSERTPKFVGSYPGGPTRGVEGGTARFRGVREKEGARSRMLRKSDDLEKRLRYVVAIVVCVAVAVTAAGSLSKRFEAQPTPEVAEQGITDLLESERKNLINELWKMEAVEALR